MGGRRPSIDDDGTVASILQDYELIVSCSGLDLASFLGLVLFLQLSVIGIAFPLSNNAILKRCSIDLPIR